jgi:hypothetical protein
VRRMRNDSQKMWSMKNFFFTFFISFNLQLFFFKILINREIDLLLSHFVHVCAWLFILRAKTTFVSSLPGA